MSTISINNSTIRTGIMIAILHHLANHSDVSLGELEDRFNMKWKDIYINLWKLHMTEVSDFTVAMPPSPFDIFGTAPEEDFPPPVDGKVPACITKKTVLPSISPQASSQFISVSLSLPELVLIIHTIDELVEVSPPSGGRSQLLHIRDLLASMAQQRGYGDVIWERTEDITSETILTTIVDALDEGQYLHLSYSTFDGAHCVEQIKEYDVIPLRIDGGARPVLRAEISAVPDDAQDGNGIRSFRLDRISSATPGEAIPKRRIAHARQRMELDAENTHYSDDSATIRITTQREALWVAEELPELTVQDRGDTLVMELPSRNYDFLARFLALTGTSIISVEPADVAERVRHIFGTLADSYADNQFASWENTL